MSADVIGFSIIILSLLLLIGFLIRLKVKAFQRYFIPSSIIAGFMGLFLGPEVLGALLSDQLPILSEGVFSLEILRVWREIPGLLITIVFATIFLGKPIMPVKEIWKIAGPQVAFGQTLAWGQYIIGIIVVLFILIPFFDVHPMMGALIEISFEGGIGTTTGLTPTFEAYGFEEGRDIGVGLATIGLISGMIGGILLINWGVKNNKTSILQAPEKLPEITLKGLYEKEKIPTAGKQTTVSSSIEALTLHFAIISAAIIIGILILYLLRLLESYTWANWTDIAIMVHFPLFPLALIGSVIVQKCLDNFTSYPIISPQLIKRINGFALDFMIASAVASLSLTIIGKHIVPFLILATAGIVWNFLAFLYIAKFIMPDYWFERGICDFGQSMGMTAVGLMLIRIADSKDKSPALSGFAYKQIFFEPIVGGGIFTAASGPLIVQWGLVPVLILTGVLGVGWCLFGFLMFGKKQTN